MLLIYSPEISARLQYTVDLVFGKLLGLKYQITSMLNELENFEGPRLAYAFKPVEGILTIPASGLLFERNITDQSTRIGRMDTWEGLPVFFGKDILSGVFYLVSRYEEYLPFEPDEHQRFQSGESLAFHLGFLDRPLVNEWVVKLGEWLKREIPGFPEIVLPEYRFLPTIDVDNAFAYLHKGLIRSIGGFKKDWKSMQERNHRYQVLRKNQPDPYDTYTMIRVLHEEIRHPPIWFFLLGSYNRYDKNISPGNKSMSQLIRELAKNNLVGIHPSYASNSQINQIRKECQKLEKITGQPVSRSRQHYLRIEMPATYRILHHLGIKEDYSMGFSERTGFRAGIAHPYLFFDLEENKMLDVTIYPFQVMDVTLQHYMKLTPDQAIEHTKQLILKTKKVGGTFCTLWHNESLSEWKNWSGWTKVYREILHAAS